ncbi:multiple sugar transport system permease protein [Caldicellulosiruptor bescii]|uniref:Binding-protein-dependent transport systems inner membrane component n=2 Tax=Caldicellulosiruptor bescii TaxID=31899 RepID=B9MMT0_CALBD|nr:sugar ABC transporter permease [Caldicellulosiruptor bescii]ACM61379.1 binding-protein-dependent transport systems inner membrane component [Caldicellulosiruptor bescii DSM 6725]PBC88810.1 multiple sugar transport system permease protein [Caldicellulosiruptor bescii]PBC91708.1 multiple sugar transport system permease protein [Caldicellulosiruptor bescii]PBD02879.1 multiple sugar transport system permease protein [Caldicellulosiruptor bescii]PBD07504.1 multiple sugar transport system permeas
MDRKEKVFGYLFLLPAVLIFIFVAVIPLVQVFVFSLFDIQLNNPTKSEVSLSYKIDVENYANTLFTATSIIDSIKMEALNDSQKKTISRIKHLLAMMEKSIFNTKTRIDRLNKVNELLNNFHPVDNKLKYLPVAAKEINQYNTYFKKIMDLTNSLPNTQEMNDLKQALLAFDQVIVKPNFVGLQNYSYYLKDSRFLSAIKNTLLFTVVTVFFELVFGLMLAVVMHKVASLKNVFKSIILLPWAIPTVISALMWKFMYDGQVGILAKFFADIGLIKSSADLLSSTTNAMIAAMTADIWKTTPYIAILLVAGLQTIPESLYEAAKVDGANAVYQFFRITLPMLKPTILVALLFRTLDAFRVFDLIYVLTGGGPANSTETVSIYTYKTLFNQLDFGRGSTLAVLIFIMVTIISFIYIKILGAEVFSHQKR